MTGRILIVDDVPTNIKLLEAKLQREYYEIIAATSGDQALEMARSQSPDLILLDIMMPGMDGFDVCRQLKLDPACSNIPVVMITALTDLEDRVRGLNAGADDFISKPVNDVPLLSRVRSLIRLKSLVDMWKVREETVQKLGLRGFGLVMDHETYLNGKVLFVSNTRHMVESLADALVEDKDQCSFTHAPSECQALLQTKQFELVVIGLDIGEQGALRLTSQIRNNSNAAIRTLPILILSMHDSEMDIVAKALDIGISDYITAPIHRPEFIARVRTQIRRYRFQERMRTNYEQSITQATIDPLTNVYNRRFLDANLSQILSRSQSSHKPLVVAFCDLDHFKQLNDTYGHQAGDAVLVEFARRLQANLRGNDLVARMGGEEFIVIMPDTMIETAAMVAERLRSKVGNEPFLLPDGRQAAVTVSIGLTCNSEGPDESIFDLVKRADEAMYFAKNSGRNRVSTSLPDRPMNLQASHV
ncbi:MAG: PleD family two-component system response regulator [Candidatus Symbiobacter sp.]|nr:PleD family two-component system response regulator [Candidatus Symbiobacter sp.]